MFSLLHTPQVRGICRLPTIQISETGSGFLVSLTLLLAAISLWPAYANGAIRAQVLNDIYAVADTTDSALLDPARLPDAGQLQQLQQQGDWLDTSLHTSLGHKREPSWLRIQLPAALPAEPVFIINNAWLEHVQLWVVQDGQILSQHSTGSRQPFEQRPLHVPRYAFPLPTTSAGGELLVRIASDTPHLVPMALMSQADFLDLTSRQSLGFGIYFGLVLIMLLYNLGLYLTVRDPVYLLYVAYAGTVSFSMLVIHGYAQQYLWPALPGMERSLSYLITAAAVAFSGLFANAFLRLREHLPAAFYGLCSMILLICLVALMGVLSPSPGVGMTVALLVMLFPVMLISFGLLRWRAGLQVAGVYVLAHSWMVIGTISYTLLLLGVLPESWFSRYGILWGSALELALLSLALGMRINEERRQRLQQQQRATHLEAQVASLQHESALARIDRDRQQALQHSQKLRTIGEMTGGFAHEFNNILAGILGFTELSREQAETLDDTRLLTYLREIETGSNRGAVLVRQLLLFSRGGKQETSLLDVRDNVRESLELLRATLPATVDLQLDLPDTPMQVTADANALRQVIINLGLNAADAMHNKGAVRVEVGRQALHSTCASCLQPIAGDYISISVADSGDGIVDDVHELFTPFYTTKEIGKGSGLGLSVVHGIVHEHQGHLGVETVLGKGSRFLVYLPPAAADAQPTVGNPAQTR